MRMLFASLALLGGCTPNPRNEIPAIVSAAMGEAQKDAPGKRLCVERTIAPWQSVAEAHRIDPPAPPGFDALYATGVYRGGGALKGDRVATVAVHGGAGCFTLRGPLIAGDQAMLEVYLPGIGWNVWLKRTAPDWRVVMTTTSQYPS